MEKAVVAKRNFCQWPLVWEKNREKWKKGVRTLWTSSLFFTLEDVYLADLIILFCFPVNYNFVGLVLQRSVCFWHNDIWTFLESKMKRKTHKHIHKLYWHGRTAGLASAAGVTLWKPICCDAAYSETWKNIFFSPKAHELNLILKQQANDCIGGTLLVIICISQRGLKH